MLLWHFAGWFLEEMDFQRAVSDSSSFTALLHPSTGLGPDCSAVRVLQDFDVDLLLDGCRCVAVEEIIHH